MADWWLGDLDDWWFKALESAVRDEWNVEPLRIREGGVSHTLVLSVPLPDVHVSSLDSLYPPYRIWKRNSVVMHFTFLLVRAR
jgi:hypothetical protein